jgi:putative sigma-54 modulation protein
MQLQIKGKNLDVSDSIRTYAERKLSKLDRMVHEDARVEIELAVEKNPSVADNQVAEATVRLKGHTLRAREASSDMKASIDLLVDKLERQVKRYKEKRRHEHERHERANGGAQAPASIPQEGAMIVKTKQFVLNAMTAEEAVEQLELIGHDFFVFRNAGSGEINVVYRRRDGDYGVIEPE